MANSQRQMNERRKKKIIQIGKAHYSGRGGGDARGMSLVSSGWQVERAAPSASSQNNTVIKFEKFRKRKKRERTFIQSRVRPAHALKAVGGAWEVGRPRTALSTGTAYPQGAPRRTTGSMPTHRVLSRFRSKNSNWRPNEGFKFLWLVFHKAINSLNILKKRANAGFFEFL